MKIRLLKMLDSIAGRAICTVLGGTRPLLCESLEPSRLLVIRPGGIGDAVLLLPVIQALTARFPQTTVDVLAERRNSAVFSLFNNVHNVFCYDKPGELKAALRGNYDTVIDTEQWHRLSAVVSRLMSGAQTLVGYGTNERKKLFSHAISYSHDDYEADSFYQLLAPFGITLSHLVPTPYITVPPGAVGRAYGLLGRYANQPFVAVFPGASVLERRWGAVRFRGVADKLSARGISVVVVGGAQDVRDGEEIVAGNGGLNLAGKTSLAVTAAVINKAALLVTGDSGILHIAVGLDIPTVSLFGPGRARKWAPRGDKHIVINKNLPCSPCTTFGYTPKCPINARCMSEITVDEVEQAVLTLLARKNANDRQQNP